MKTKARWIFFAAVVAVVLAGGVYYIVRIESRADLLEKRLALVEAELHKQPAQFLQPEGPGTSRDQAFVRKPGSAVPAGRTDPLESRVEKIERELAPHVELLAPAYQGPPPIQR